MILTWAISFFWVCYSGIIWYSVSFAWAIFMAIFFICEMIYKLAFRVVVTSIFARLVIYVLFLPQVVFISTSSFDWCETCLIIYNKSQDGAYEAWWFIRFVSKLLKFSTNTHPEKKLSYQQYLISLMWSIYAQLKS